MIVLRLSGAILLVAASLKLLGSPDASEVIAGGLSARGFAGLELGLGAWFLMAPWPRKTRWLALVTFSGLLGVALAETLHGARSCKCFGDFSPAPWWMVLLDGLVLAALVFAARGTESQHWGRSAAACGALAGGAAVVGYGMLAWRPPTVPPSRAVVLTASGWEGNAALVLEHADNGNEFRRGNWVIMLHRPGCQSCREALAHYRKRAFECRARNLPIRFALIQVSEADDPESTLPDTECLVAGRLREHRRWLVQTPLFLWAKDGQVYRASDKLLGWGL